MSTRFYALIIAAALSLTGCGGGGLGHLLGLPAIPTASPAPSIQVTPTTLTIAAGSTGTITASENSSSPFFTAQSTDATIATVAQSNTATNAFVVSGVKAGKCNITISDAYGSTATVAITVH